MAIKEEDLSRIRKYLDKAKRAVYFFDDDPDGLSSFLLFYKYKKSGKGVIVKSSPMLKEEYAARANEYYADTVFVLDKPIVSQDFINNCISKQIVVLDHHEPIKRKGLHYFNPRLGDNSDNRPTSYWAYRVVKQDLWIAMIGMIGDWFLADDLKDSFSELYPDLLPKKVDKPEEALFNTKLGELSRIFSFVLKGKSREVMKAIKILTRIETPYEILNQETPRGKFIYKKYLKVKKEYELLLAASLKKKAKHSILLFTYPGRKMSFTGELSNELLYRFPDKINIIGRLKSGEYRCSIRSRDYDLPKLLKKSLAGISGYGGGHKHACGASIKKEDFEKFISQFKEAVKEKASGKN